MTRTSGRLLFQSEMSIRFVAMRMHVRLASVPVHVLVDHSGAVLGSKAFRDPSRSAAEIQHAQEDQHQPDRQFHGQPKAWRDRQVEHDDSRADQHNGDGMTETPKHTDHTRMADALLPADNSRDRDHVIGIGGMTDAQQEAHANDGQETNHALYLPTSLPGTADAECLERDSDLNPRDYTRAVKPREPLSP